MTFNALVSKIPKICDLIPVNFLQVLTGTLAHFERVNHEVLELFRGDCSVGEIVEIDF
jgi:hypothetical protein